MSEGAQIGLSMLALLGPISLAILVDQIRTRMRIRRRLEQERRDRIEAQYRAFGELARRQDAAVWSTGLLAHQAAKGAPVKPEIPDLDELRIGLQSSKGQEIRERVAQQLEGVRRNAPHPQSIGVFETPFWPSVTATGGPTQQGIAPGILLPGRRSAREFLDSQRQRAQRVGANPNMIFRDNTSIVSTPMTMVNWGTDTGTSATINTSTESFSSFSGGESGGAGGGGSFDAPAGSE